MPTLKKHGRMVIMYLNRPNRPFQYVQVTLIPDERPSKTRACLFPDDPFRTFRQSIMMLKLDALRGLRRNSVITAANAFVMLIGGALLYSGISGKVRILLPGGTVIVGSVGAIMMLMAAADMLEWISVLS